MTLRNFFVGRAVGLLVVLAVVGLVWGFYAFNNYIYEQKQASAAGSYKDAEYIVEGVRVVLKNGVAKVDAAPGSASQVVTKYFGNEIFADLDDDGREDVVFLLTQQSGGSGVFYYVVAALNTERGYVGSQALLLGDRIAPQTIEKGRQDSQSKIVIVNYADRAQGEPFSTAPSVGKSIWFKLDPQAMQFGEVVQDFEGEANPDIMTLDMKPWVWVSALYNDGREIKPKTSGDFVLTFGEEGRFTAATDCNSMAGSYEAGESTITFSQIMSTKMYCEGSQEGDFALLLETASGYHFTSRGQLILDLKFDSGSVVFR